MDLRPVNTGSPAPGVAALPLSYAASLSAFILLIFLIGAVAYAVFDCCRGSIEISAITKIWLAKRDD